jgi:hypothetical protein
MRTILCILAIALFPLLSFGQEAEKYISVEERFVKYYNKGMSDSLLSLFAGPKYGHGSWTAADISRNHQKFGKILSFKFMFLNDHGKDTEGRPMAYFKATFDKEFQEKNIHAMAFSLTEESKIFGIAFITSDDYVDKEILKY